MHLYFYCFSDETIHVAGFCGKEFGFLQSDNVVLIEARAHHFLLALPLPRSNPTRYKYPAQSSY